MEQAYFSSQSTYRNNKEDEGDQLGRNALH